MNDETDVRKWLEKTTDDGMEITVRIDVEGVGGERALAIADALFLACEDSYTDREWENEP